MKQKPESPPKKCKIPRVPKPLKKSTRDNMRYVEQAPSPTKKSNMTLKPAFRRKTSQGSVVYKKNVLKETIEITNGNMAEMKALEVMMPQDGASGYYMDLPKFQKQVEDAEKLLENPITKLVYQKLMRLGDKMGAFGSK